MSFNCNVDSIYLSNIAQILRSETLSYSAMLSTGIYMANWGIKASNSNLKPLLNPHSSHASQCGAYLLHLLREEHEHLNNIHAKKIQMTPQLLHSIICTKTTNPGNLKYTNSDKI